MRRARALGAGGGARAAPARRGGGRRRRARGARRGQAWRGRCRTPSRTEEERCSTPSRLVIKSPGVPGEAPLVAARARAGSPSGARSSSARGCFRTRFVGVTGTNGKTTTTELLGAIIRAAAPSRSPATSAARSPTLDGQVEPGRVVVCEVSSFQLEDVHEFRPRVAVLLNLEPDHLDRHGSLEAYRDAKLRIFENQGDGDTAIVPRGFDEVPGRGRGSSSRPTTRCRPSRASPARTTARTRRPRPPRRARSASTTRASPRRSRPSRASPHRLELVARGSAACAT